jgi:hypothetical protein
MPLEPGDLFDELFEDGFPESIFGDPCFAVFNCSKHDFNAAWN